MFFRIIWILRTVWWIGELGVRYVQTVHLTDSKPEVGAQIKNFNAQVQIAQPKFLGYRASANCASKNIIGKAQAQIA